MEPITFNCRAVNIEHSCSHENDQEVNIHSKDDIECIEGIVNIMEGMSFKGVIKSKGNSNQIDVDFDSAWINKIRDAHWKTVTLSKIKEFKDIPNIQPDAIMTKDGKTVVVEIEKSNKKSIWFDFIKILMLTDKKKKQADFGLLIVPRNYAHRYAVWDLFKEARYYRWCLLRFAKIDPQLMSKIAIIGYTQETDISGSWKQFDLDIIKEVKSLARDHFSK